MTAPSESRTPAAETAASPPRKALNPMLKFALELGPLALFFRRLFAAAASSPRPASPMAGVLVTLQC